MPVQDAGGGREGLLGPAAALGRWEVPGLLGSARDQQGSCFDEEQNAVFLFGVFTATSALVWDVTLT